MRLTENTYEPQKNVQLFNLTIQIILFSIIIDLEYFFELHCCLKY
jgi:hypothetical protein